MTGTGSGVRRGWRAIAISAVILVGVSVAAVVGLYVVKTDPSRVNALLDELAIPSSWTSAHTAASPSVLFQSWIARYYLVDAPPDALIEGARGFLKAAGWPVQSGDYPDCRSNGPSGPVTCFLRADRGSMILLVTVWDREQGLDPYSPQGDTDFRPLDPDRSLVRILIHY